jgi:hypothetical protein
MENMLLEVLQNDFIKRKDMTTDCEETALAFSSS